MAEVDEVLGRRKLSGLAREAVHIESASNLLGLSKRFGPMLDELLEALKLVGEKPSHSHLASHPIARVWVSKLSSLVGRAGEVDEQMLHLLVRSGMQLEYTQIDGISLQSDDLTVRVFADVAGDTVLLGRYPVASRPDTKGLIGLPVLAAREVLEKSVKAAVAKEAKKTKSRSKGKSK